MRHQVLFPLCLLSVLGAPICPCLSVYVCVFDTLIVALCFMLKRKKKSLQLHLLSHSPLDLVLTPFKNRKQKANQRQSQFAQQKVTSCPAPLVRSPLDGLFQRELSPRVSNQAPSTVRSGLDPRLWIPSLFSSTPALLPRSVGPFLAFPAPRIGPGWR